MFLRSLLIARTALLLLVQRVTGPLRRRTTTRSRASGRSGSCANLAAPGRALCTPGSLSGSARRPAPGSAAPGTPRDPGRRGRSGRLGHQGPALRDARACREPLRLDRPGAPRDQRGRPGESRSAARRTPGHDQVVRPRTRPRAGRTPGTPNARRCTPVPALDRAPSAARATCGAGPHRAPGTRPGARGADRRGRWPRASRTIPA